MKKYSLLIIFILFLIIVYHTWIFSNGIFTYGDWWYFWNESLISVRVSYFNIWISDFNLGRVSLGIGQALTWGAYGFLNRLIGADYQLGLKIVHLFPIIIFTPLGMFVLLKKYIKSNIAQLIGVLAYCFNTYFLTLQTGHLTLMVAYSLLPFILYFFIETLEKKSIVYGVTTALILSLASAYEPRVAYITLLILFMYFLYELFNNIRGYKKLIITAFYAGFPVLLFILLNLYWIVGLAFTGSIVENELFSRSLFGNEFLNILYAITTFHPFWTGIQPNVFVLEDIPMYQWFIPMGAILGVYLNRKNSFAVFALLLGLVGILLTKQSGMPFQDLYLWLYTHFPGFNAYREASKFFSLIVLSYAILIAFLAEFIINNQFKNKHFLYLGYTLLIVITSIFLFNTKPFINGSINTVFISRHIPQDYFLFKNILISENHYSRTLWVPTLSRWGLITINHPAISLVETMNSDWLKQTILFRDDEKTAGQIMLSFIRSEKFGELVNDSNIKYIVVPIQDSANDDNFFQYYFKSRNEYITTLNSLSYLQKKQIGQSSLVIYENKNYLDHIRFASPSATPTSMLHYNLVSPTEYTIKANNIKDTTSIIFSDIYNPNWRVRIGKFNWFNSIFDKRYYLPSSVNSPSSSGMNSFYFNSDEVCKIYSCVKNADGTYNVEMTLYFSKQAVVNLSLIISGGTLGTLIIYLLYSFWRRKP